MDVKVGSKVPDFEGVDQHGNTVAVRDLLASVSRCGVVFPAPVRCAHGPLGPRPRSVPCKSPSGSR